MSVAAPARRLWTPRLVATLALFVVSATFFSVIVGYALVSQADDLHSLERRGTPLGALHGARGGGRRSCGAQSRRFAPRPQVSPPSTPATSRASNGSRASRICVS